VAIPVNGRDEEAYIEPYTEAELAKITKFMLMQALDSDTIAFTYYTRNLTGLFFSWVTQICILAEATQTPAVVILFFLNIIGPLSQYWFQIYLYFCNPLPSNINRFIMYNFGNDQVIASKMCYTPKHKYWTEVYFGMVDSLANAGFRVKNLLHRDPTNFDPNLLLNEMVPWRENRLKARRFLIFLIKMGDFCVLLGLLINIIMGPNGQNVCGFIFKLIGFMVLALTLADPDIDVFDQELHEMKVSFSPFNSGLRAYKHSWVHVWKCNVPDIDLLGKAINPFYRDVHEADRAAAFEFFNLMLKSTKYTLYPPDYRRFADMDLSLSDRTTTPAGRYYKQPPPPPPSGGGYNHSGYNNMNDHREPLVTTSEATYVVTPDSYTPNNNNSYPTTQRFGGNYEEGGREVPTAKPRDGRVRV
jgi:hypothetical protein